jgi:hypothetical protein
VLVRGRGAPVMATDPGEARPPLQDLEEFRENSRAFPAWMRIRTFLGEEERPLTPGHAYLERWVRSCQRSLESL